MAHFFACRRSQVQIKNIDKMGKRMGHDQRAHHKPNEQEQVCGKWKTVEGAVKMLQGRTGRKGRIKSATWVRCIRVAPALLRISTI
jgi:hypothetical protein